MILILPRGTMPLRDALTSAISVAIEGLRGEKFFGEDAFEPVDRNV